MRTFGRELRCDVKTGNGKAEQRCESESESEKRLEGEKTSRKRDLIDKGSLSREATSRVGG
jgi:hypothetical protein